MRIPQNLPSVDRAPEPEADKPSKPAGGAAEDAVPANPEPDRGPVLTPEEGKAQQQARNEEARALYRQRIEDGRLIHW